MSRRPSPLKSTAYLQERRRHELALAHRAGPRPDHVVGPDVALIEDFQGGDQLGAEHRAAAALIGQRRQRRRHEIAAHRAPEIALDAPQRDDEARLHVEALPHLLQQGPVVDEMLAHIVEPLLGDDLLQVLAEGNLRSGCSRSSSTTFGRNWM